MAAAAIIVVVSAVSLAGRSSGGATSGSTSKATHGHALAGTFSLFGPKTQKDPCSVRSADVAAGAPVAVKDERGAAIGSGALTSGSADSARKACVYRFNVSSLPDSNAYTVEVGKLGGLKYTATDLAKSGWKVSLNLGVA